MKNIKYIIMFLLAIFIPILYQSHMLFSDRLVNWFVYSNNEHPIQDYIYIANYNLIIILLSSYIWYNSNNKYLSKMAWMIALYFLINITCYLLFDDGISILKFKIPYINKYINIIHIYVIDIIAYTTYKYFNRNQKHAA